MKKILTSAALLFLFAGAANAQHAFNAAEFKNNLGKTGTLCDTVYSMKMVNDTLTLLNLGGAYPHQKYTVAVKGKTKLDLPHIKGKQVCVTGTFEMFKEQPEVVASQPQQIEVH
ncbi:hypothetical protein [Mucilaginibacter lappiensis]|uniref:tRNA_anti-like n=1 Tax=Mucilaginibacter lappiensis TaxID=354630 RepID=A0A1N6ZYF2_9SPHI|nr:hypothetical protein [Mucilaginibacter lappiensis]MBB6110367.1 hypothetical protein [Mucilaginibacter lappiensis]MBB6128527.1 hypothetical protein [Mucilaginibacter lappiensis]SIR31870.1 hypothetical protein SAMN05421821_106176 [Mucilaginibacter lappiensis]